MTSTPPDDRPKPSWVRRLSQLDLLGALVLLQVSQSFLSADSVIQRALFNLLFLAVVVSAVRTLSKSRVRMILVITTGVMGYAVSTYAEFHPSIAVTTATDVCYIFVFILLMIVLADNVFGDGPVDLNRIVGSVSIYFVLGLVFALVYSLLETFQPGAFGLPPVSKVAGSHQTMFSELFYFSNVTLTTLGYGDINPVSRPARTLATMEAIIGQLYLAIVMARLVGLHIAQKG